MLREGKNAFAGEQEFGPLRVSDTFLWFLGGLIHRVQDVMVFYAPTINSYKRYEDGSWAPTRIAWCHDNRTAGFRVVGRGESLRIRMPNPRRRLQSLSGICRHARLRSRWHRQPDRPA